jgi:hypothetical protein
MNNKRKMKKKKEKKKKMLDPISLIAVLIRIKSERD